MAEEPTDYEVVARLRKPLRLSNLTALTDALSIEYGPDLFMVDEGDEWFVIARNVPPTKET